ncbi:MAG: DUF3656 domain-containing protein [Lachnospiraceae bacterium]|nr:DUF3656 domain-containing protein [Lachnospiraceae bacterium]
MFNPNLEILAPCGSYEILKTAIHAGADACYIGGSKFGARAYAENVSNVLLEQAVDYTHIHGKKLYLTVNTLFKEKELSEGYEYIKFCYEAGVDAFIVQDLGLFKLIRDNFPDTNIHCSTQMNITSVHAAGYMRGQGASRVVTAREMSLDEIRKIKENVDIEVETFVHGAMCYSYSGQCLLSSLAGGRSGNRGRCAQPCRKCYDGEYLLSMKDMCSLELIPELIEAGIDSLKIEGRMKNEYYVASAVSAYKELSEDYINGSFDINKAKKYKFKLANIYNRGGFTDGYFFTHNSSDMISKDRPNNQGVKIGRLKAVKDGRVLISLCEDLYKGDVLEIRLNYRKEYKKDNQSYKDYNIYGDNHHNEYIELTSDVDGTKGKEIWLNAPKTKYISINQDIYRTRCKHILEEYKDINKKNIVSAVFNGQIGKNISLVLKEIIDDKAFEYEALGDIVEHADNKKADKVQIARKINQLGNTDYIISQLELNVDDEAFIPAGVIKQLRRSAIEGLENKLVKYFKRYSEDIGYEKYRNRCDLSKLETADISSDEIEMSLSNNDYPKLKVGVRTIEQLETVLEFNNIYGIYMNRRLCRWIKDKPLYNTLRDKKIQLYIELPYVINGDFEVDEYLKDISYDGIYIRNIDAFSVKKVYNKDVVCGAGLYAYNNLARDFLLGSEKGKGITFELPKELNLKELKTLDGSVSELIVYEYQQVMLANNCVLKTKNKCNHNNEVVKINDDRSNGFYAVCHCDECINTIYNGMPFVIFDKDIDTEFVKYHRINFIIEERDMVKKVMEAYLNGTKLESEYTTGHIKRGVE